MKCRQPRWPIPSMNKNTTHGRDDRFFSLPTAFLRVLQAQLIRRSMTPCSVNIERIVLRWVSPPSSSNKSWPFLLSLQPTLNDFPHDFINHPLHRLSQCSSILFLGWSTSAQDNARTTRSSPCSCAISNKHIVHLFNIQQDGASRQPVVQRTACCKPCNLISFDRRGFVIDLSLALEFELRHPRRSSTIAEVRVQQRCR